MATYAVIMAGGIGSRFWPASRKARPKQFLNVFGDATLIQNTVARLQGLVPPERCLIVTHERYVQQTKEQLPAVPEENILAEPISRNTAPCIAYAGAKLQARDKDATMIVLPADHMIQNVQRFHETLHVAIEAAQAPETLVTIGIQPTHPATGYGYIQYDGPSIDEAALDAYPVRTFAEKPDVATAERFIDSGDFLWNSGMFIWRADTIMEQLHTHLPKAYEAFQPVREAADTPEEQEVLHTAFQESPRISIDYGVMERADTVRVVPGDFGWSDVGDWRAVYELRDKDEHGNALEGQVIVHDSSRNYVQSDDDRLVVLVGMHDTVVVETDDALLVCKRESTQQVKNVVEYLHAHQLDEYT
ncbi:mannose-1-phosphate guanylyltransferase [Salisaeta longa]|uniref:mannose-1-phosphate guanylyltransferase n=1 Tax=Salisaeta longa TaxID=503170 RepID=UPI0003B54623|nr:mannose-1-phosphate guanylyltransferase [Salisaeta longa]